MEEVCFNDIGVEFRITVLKTDGSILSLVGANELRLDVVKPNNIVHSYTASLYTDGTDGIMKYTTVDGDLDKVGIWSVQGYVDIPAGKFRTINRLKFKVLEKVV